jgi:hypothetical protein
MKKYLNDLQSYVIGNYMYPREYFKNFIKYSSLQDMELILKKISEIDDKYYYSMKKKENDIFSLLLQFREMSNKIIDDTLNRNNFNREDYIKFIYNNKKEL